KRPTLNVQRPISKSKLPPQFDGAGEQMQVMGARNFHRTELLQVGGKPLGVEQCEFFGAQMFHQTDERDLGGVLFPMKHRFAKKCATDGDTIKAAREFAFAPSRDGMGITEFVQSRVTFATVAIYPVLV